MVVPNAKSPYWLEAASGLNRAAAEIKVTATMAGPDSFAPDRQAAEFKRVAAQKPAGILVSVSDAKLLGPEIDAAIAAGIPVVTIDSDAPESRRMTFVGTNNYEAGLMGGRATAAKLNGKGNVLVFTTSGQPNLEDRLKGYRAAFEATPGIRITEVVDIKGDPGKAFDGATEALTGKTPPDAFVSMEGQSAKEVAEVMTRKKAQGKIVVAMDALEPTLEGISKGTISATIAQKPFTMAYVGLRVLADVALHKVPNMKTDFLRDPHSPMPRFIDTGASMIDKSNLDAYRESSKQASAPAAK